MYISYIFNTDRYSTVKFACIEYTQIRITNIDPQSQIHVYSYRASISWKPKTSLQ